MSSEKLWNKTDKLIKYINMHWGQSVQGCDEEGQSPPETVAGKGCQKQQEGLLQLHQQQNED